MVALTGGGATLPRHLRCAVVKLLRPAEAAARRLIIVAARGLVVTLPPPRLRKPKLMNPEPMLRRLGIAVTMSRADFARAAAAKRAAAIRAARPRTMCLPLLDPLGQPFRVYRRYVAAHAAPRIKSLDFDAPYSLLPPPPSPDDPVSAARLMLRLEALGRALDDLPGQARRFARRKARRDAADAQLKQDRETGVQGKSRDAAGAQDKQRPGRVRFRRLWPLKPGRPPDWRRKPVHEVHEVLDVVHRLACWVLQSPDMSSRRCP